MAFKKSGIKAGQVDDLYWVSKPMGRNKFHGLCVFYMDHYRRQVSKYSTENLL